MSNEKSKHSFLAKQIGAIAVPQTTAKGSGSMRKLTGRFFAKARARTQQSLAKIDGRAEVSQICVFRAPNISYFKRIITVSRRKSAKHTSDRNVKLVKEKRRKCSPTPRQQVFNTQNVRTDTARALTAC